ncbi:MAG: SIS domain-containing protein [Proteobacteria bacterium]|nr:SIS domain-containing protein [Pseudomonadota bacterium]
MNDNQFKEIILNSLNDAKTGLENLIRNQTTLESIANAATAISDCVNNNGRIFSCGNGGSMCDAMHFAEELTGRFRQNRKAIAATAISDPGHLSCVANDFGYEYVFSRYLEAHGRKGDILLGISTSGTSKNILEAAKTAKSLGMGVVALTGKESCQLADISNIHIPTPAGTWADRVQELHIKVIHILIQSIESKLS